MNDEIPYHMGGWHKVHVCVNVYCFCDGIVRRHAEYRLGPVNSNTNSE